MYILAAGDDPTVKIVIGVVVAAIWIISQVIGALTKKPDQQRPPSRLPPTAGRPPDMPQRQPPMGRTNVPRSQPPVPPRIKRQKPPPVRQQPQTVQSRPAPAALPTAQPFTRRAPLADAPSPKPAAAAGIPRRQMLNALLKVRNLRKAYILAEVLQPPVALRPAAGGDEAGRP
ncbi:MAG TPA: hypothetical protein VF595_03810 [Tepidisphaeraceae bacterium]